MTITERSPATTYTGSSGQRAHDPGYTRTYDVRSPQEVEAELVAARRVIAETRRLVDDIALTEAERCQSMLGHCARRARHTESCLMRGSEEALVVLAAVSTLAAYDKARSGT